MLCIVLDTNILNSGSRDFTILRFIPKLEEIIREFEASDYVKELKILLPRIVIDELFIHQLDDYRQEVDRIRGLKLPNNKIVLLEDYHAFLSELLNQQIALFDSWNFPCEVLPYPDNTCLTGIIQRSLDKKAPFEGTNKQSDKGFKDVILWESILAYKRKHQDDSFILFSQDGRITDSELAAEFKSEFGTEIALLKRTQDNDNSALYNKVASLVRSLTPQHRISLSESIRQRVMLVVNEYNLLRLWADRVFDYNGQSVICKSVSVVSESLVSIEDLDDGSLTQYKVTTKLRVYGETSNSFTEFTSECNFIIEYYIDDDQLYLREYDSYDLGYREFDFKGFILDI